MKKLTYLSLLFLIIATTSCDDGSPKKDAVADESSAVCIWDKASLQEKPEKNGKWLSSISLGEKLTYLNSSKEEETGGKKTNYLKVKLLDGKEGWVRADFVAVGANVAVVTDKTNTYSRPDLSTVSKNSFEPLDIIAIKSTQGDWTEVTGKRQAGKWIETTWIKSKSLSYDEKDIAAAVYIRRALAQPKKENKIAELKKINDISDVKGSVFDAKINELIDSFTSENIPTNADMTMDSTGY